MEYSCRAVRSGVITCAALVAALLVGCGGARAGDATKTAGGAEAEPKRLTPAEIAERSTPSIVAIRTSEGLGTGFVVREDGWIVTNLHVVAGSDRVVVHLPDERTFPVVEIINASAPHDLVVLRIETNKLTPLELGDKERVRPGEPIVAIGHPLGLQDTISNGLLSGVRDIDGLTLLQVSAPIAPGSSGGPLFNEQGKVIGVAMAILVGGQNLNLGLPARYVRELMDAPEPMAFSQFAALVKKLQRQAAPPDRKIPRHPPTIFTGCTTQAIALIAHGISEAVAVGAPLYNDGNHRASYQIYQGAASDIENRLPRACQGPKRALAKGRARAAALKQPSEQAWAMRDAFDGLAEAITRRMHDGSRER